MRDRNQINDNMINVERAGTSFITKPLPTVVMYREKVLQGLEKVHGSAGKNAEIKTGDVSSKSNEYEEHMIYYQPAKTNKNHLLNKKYFSVQGIHNIFKENTFSKPARMPGTESNRQQQIQNNNINNNSRQSTNQTRNNNYPPHQYIYYPHQPANTRDTQPYRDRRQTAHTVLVVRNEEAENDNYLFDKKLRKDFVFKVYMILTGLLLFSFGMCLIANMVLPVKRFCIKYYWIAYIFLILYFIVMITLMCFKAVRRSSPINLILLLFMTLCMTGALCVLCAIFETNAVLYALGTTVIITVVVSVFAKFSPFDVTGCGILICILAMVFSLYTLITFVISLFIYSPLMHLIYGGIGTVLYTFFLFFDTQQILGGRRVELSAEEYVLGVILLYTDIIMIFLMLLNVYSYSD